MSNLKYRERVLDEMEKIPEEYLPTLLKILRAFREGVTLPGAEESFRRGFEEALSDQTRPLSELWDDLHAR